MSNKVLTAHQPVYLPWLGLLHKIALADEFVYFDDVQYQNKDWNNRNKVKGSNGEVMLTVPVFNKDHYNLKLKDVEIRNDVPWRKKHRKTIAMSYAKAPYAKKYIPFFDDLYNKEWKMLADLNEAILKFFMSELNLKPTFKKLSDMNLTTAKSQLVLDMCLACKADLYIFGIQGKDYADQAAFASAGVKLIFQDYQHPEYDQLHGSFKSHMAALDLLFNHGPNSLDILMSGNLNRDEINKEHFGLTSV